MELLVNEDTQLIQDNIRKVLAELFSTYGIVHTEEVKENETEIRTMVFHPYDPLIILFGPIEKLQKLIEAVNIGYTKQQILDIRLTVIKNTRDFERVLMDWQAKPANTKT